MALIEKLGASTKSSRLLSQILDERFVRDTAQQYHIAVPGFRAGQAPSGLTVRAILRAATRTRKLRAHLEAELARLAERERGRVGETDDDDVIETLDALSELPRARAVATLLAALDDVRDPVRSAAEAVRDAIESGEVTLAPPRPQPRGDARPRTPSASQTPPTTDVRQLQSLVADRDRQLRVLRSESAKLEQRVSRLRTQLESEREAHRRTRTGRPAATSDPADRDDERVDARVLRRTQKELHQLRGEHVKTKLALDAALRDYSLLASGIHELQDLVTHFVNGPRPEGPVTPTRPARTSTLPVESKLKLPSSEHHWPKGFRGFLRRLAENPHVERLQPLDFSRATQTRITLEVPDTALVAQFSDGDLAARFLIATTATSPATLAWVRRELEHAVFAPV